jgi:hypothetical protein
MGRYTTPAGEGLSVYSWKLVETDATPSGKKEIEPLRDIEKKTLRDLDDAIQTTDAGRITVNEMFDRIQFYTKLNNEVRFTPSFTPFDCQIMRVCK